VQSVPHQEWQLSLGTEAAERTTAEAALKALSNWSCLVRITIKLAHTDFMGHLILPPAFNTLARSCGEAAPGSRSSKAQEAAGEASKGA